MEGDELDLGPVLDSLRRRLLILLLFALAGALSALLLTRFFMQPIYRASARILVESGQAPALTAAGAIPVAADTYVELVRGEWLKREVARRLDLPLSGSLPFELAARSVRGTQMVVLEAESPDPKLASDAARAVLSVLQELVRQRQAERFAAAEQRLEGQIGELTAELNRVRGALAQARSEAERAALADQASRLQAALGQLQASYGNLKLAQAQAGDLIIVLEPPATPERPVRPAPLLNAAVGGSLGLLLGIAYAAAAAVLDRRFRGLKEVEEMLRLPVLAALYRENPGSGGGYNAEAFRILRTNIRFSAADRPLKVVGVGAVEPEAGKTTVAVGLARALAALGQRILLADADLRRPSLHDLFGLGRSPGLSDWLVNPALEAERVLRPVGEGLWVLPAGTPAPNPADLLASRRFGELIRLLAGEFDLVVLDSAPAVAGADLLNVAAAADGFILVVSLGLTEREEAGRLTAQLKGEGVRILGVVVNRVEPKGTRYYYYHEGDRRLRLRLRWPLARRG